MCCLLYTSSDAVAAIAEGYGGTISQHADVQAYLTLRVLRNSLDGVDIDTGIGTCLLYTSINAATPNARNIRGDAC